MPSVQIARAARSNAAERRINASPTAQATVDRIITPRTTAMELIRGVLSLCELLRQLFVVCSRVAGADVGRREDLTDLALSFAGNVKELPRQLDRFFLRLCLEQGEAGDQFLRLGERTVRNR